MTRTTGRPLAVMIHSLTALALVTAVGCKRSDAAATPAATVTTVGREVIAIVRADTIESGPVVQGTIVPERDAKLRAQVSGPVLRTFAEQGERVKAGAILAQLDDRTFREAWLSAKSSLANAQNSADIAAREFARAERLIKEGAIANRDLEVASRSNMTAQSAVEDAKSRLATAEENLARTRITAPFAGVVSERGVSAGDVVAPGAAMYTVVDPSTMRLEAAVPAEQLGAIRIGARVKFSVNGYGDRKFVGTVTRINPTADPVTRQVRVYATIPNEARGGVALVGGLFAEGRIASSSRIGLVAPSGAVDQRGVAPQVVRVKNGRVEHVTVELGLHDKVAELFEIRAGLSAGDTLLVGAAQGISVGTPVRVSEPTDRPVSKP